MLIPEDHPLLYTQDDAQSHDIQMEMRIISVILCSFKADAMNEISLFAMPKGGK